MEQPNFKEIASNVLKQEKEVQDINVHLEALKNDKIYLEEEIKDLKKREIYDDNGTSIEIEIQNKEKELRKIQEEIKDWLGGDKKEDADLRNINLN